MNIKLFASAVASALMIAGSASAAGLSFIGITGTDTLDGGFSLSASTGLGSGDSITTITNAAPGGLAVDADDVTFRVEYLGSEAAHRNDAMELSMGTVLFDNTTSMIGDTASFIGGLAGFVEFLFRDISDSQFIANGFTGGSSNGLTIGFSDISSDGKSVIALFGDGAGDADFDDLAIRISIVPLPAGGLLLLTALGGVGLARRKKSNA